VECGDSSPRWSVIPQTKLQKNKKERTGDWIQTFTGRKFWPLDARPEEIDIYDIAHALALQCRYVGHVTVFYSVAQHSDLASELVTADRDRLWALLHDASEAYLSDVSRPVKHSSGFGFYREAEKRVQAAICHRFGLTVEEPPSIKEVDTRQVSTERRDLMVGKHAWGTDRFAAFDRRIVAWAWEVAEERFLSRFFELGGVA
jgi:hypothetical protein